ncbi:F-box protein-like protein [Tanacetum coccineum]
MRGARLIPESQLELVPQIGNIINKRKSVHQFEDDVSEMENRKKKKKRRLICTSWPLDDFPELMHRILSSLPAKEAARTCVLSKSWLHAWSTIPNIRFPFKFILPQNKYNQFMERSLLRYESNNVPIETFDLGITISDHGSASLAENWIRHVSSKTCLKELFFNISVSLASFTLPAEIFLSDRLKTVYIIADDVVFFDSLRISSNSVIKCVSLRVLDLQSVSISDGVLHNLLNTCSLLEKVNISCCDGLKTVTVKSLRNLKELKIHSVDESPVLEISDVPSLCELRYLPMLFPMTKPPPFDMESLGSVTQLNVGGIILDDAFFDIIRSKLHFLESLTLGIGHWAQKSLVITSGSLKRLAVRLWIYKQIDIEVYASNLLLCICEGGKPIPRLSFPITPPEQFKLTVI